MPSTITWLGNAAAVAQVDTVTVGGTIEADDVFNLTIGNKTLSVTGGSTSAADVALAIVTAWNLLTQAQAPEFYEVVAADNEDGSFSLTARTAGKPFVCTVSTTEAGGGGGDDQSFSLENETASAGPNDASTAANYSGASLPSTGDTLVFENNDVSVLYGLDALDEVTLAALIVKQSYTGYIGLPRTNGSGTTAYSEYRDQYFRVGATALRIGEGEGSGSGRLKIDLGSVKTTASIFNSGNRAESYVPAVLLLGTHASNVLNVLKGTVGIAFFTAEVSTIATMTIGYSTNVLGDAEVRCGSGVTLNIVTKAGGKLFVESSITMLTQYDGEITIGSDAAISSGTVGGTIYDYSTGTFLSLTLLAKAVYDHSKSLSAKTIAMFIMNRGSVYRDPYGVLTLASGIKLNACTPADVTIDIAAGRTLDIS